MTMRRHLGTICLAAAAMSATPALAGGLWPFFQNCSDSGATQQTCIVNRVIGNGNSAVTVTRMHNSNSRQFSLTYQKGDNNVAITKMVSEDNDEDQHALTVQKGDGHHSFTYVNGEDSTSTTLQTGQGTWAATSSVGEGNETSVELHSW
jgi:hypothetical protein